MLPPLLYNVKSIQFNFWTHGRLMLRQTAQRIIVVLPIILAMATGCSGQPPPSTPESVPTPESFPSRELTVLVGAGEKTAAINAFFPRQLTIRAGDTVNWKMNTEGDPHSVIFTDQQPEDDVIP